MDDGTSVEAEVEETGDARMLGVEGIRNLLEC